jgi:hypothetical protein
VVQVHLGPRSARSVGKAVDTPGGPRVKKLLLLAVAAAAGYVVYQKIQQDRAEQDLWNEAVAPVVDLR